MSISLGFGHLHCFQLFKPVTLADLPVFPYSIFFFFSWGHKHSWMIFCKPPHSYLSTEISFAISQRIGLYTSFVMMLFTGIIAYLSLAFCNGINSIRVRIVSLLLTSVWSPSPLPLSLCQWNLIQISNPVPSTTPPMFLRRLCSHTTVGVALIDLISIFIAMKFSSWGMWCIWASELQGEIWWEHLLHLLEKLPKINSFFWACDTCPESDKSDSSYEAEDEVSAQMRGKPRECSAVELESKGYVTPETNSTTRLLIMWANKCYLSQFNWDFSIICSQIHHI